TAHTKAGERVDAVAVGSPHFSLAEFRRLLAALDGRRLAIPFYVCTGRHTLNELQLAGIDLTPSGLTVVADTCIVVTPILPSNTGLLLTNSGKFAHYTRPNTGYDVLYGSLADCAETAVAGRLLSSETLWKYSPGCPDPPKARCSSCRRCRCGAASIRSPAGSPIPRCRIAG